MLPNLRSASSHRHDSSFGQDQHQKALVDSIGEFNEFYRQMTDKLQKLSMMRSNNPELETFKQASEILCEVQKYANPKSFETRPTWLNQVIECAKQSKNQRT